MELTRPVVELQRFVEDNAAIYNCLIDCWEPIQRIFGVGTVVKIALEEDPEDGTCCVWVRIEFNGGMEDGSAKLKEFDETFWYARARDCSPGLGFNIEWTR